MRFFQKCLESLFLGNYTNMRVLLLVLIVGCLSLVGCSGPFSTGVPIDQTKIASLNRWDTGTTAPTLSGTLVNGQKYVNNTTGAIYEYVSSSNAWVIVDNIHNLPH